MRTPLSGVVIAVFVAGGLALASSPDEAEVLALDQKIADAVVRGDTAYVYSVTRDDFVMVHGDGWTNGGKPLLTDSKASLLGRVTAKYYDVIAFDSVKAEMHGDIAITYGRYVAHTSGGDEPSMRWFAVWFERVYAKRNGKWIYLSHRTVHGPTYGADRAAVQDK
jgi:ketosteroid isomerase-like protein